MSKIKIIGKIQLTEHKKPTWKLSCDFCGKNHSPQKISSNSFLSSGKLVYRNICEICYYSQLENN